MDAEDRQSASAMTSDRCGVMGAGTDGSSDEDVPSQGSFDDEEAALPPGLDWLQELYEEDDVGGDGDLAVAANSVKKRSYAATARMFKLRRNLDQLDCFHRQKEHDVLKAREELKLCRQNIEALVEQRDNLEDEIEQHKAVDNNVVVFRLRAQHKQLCQRLQSEEELEGHINTELNHQELKLSELEVELGSLSSLRQEVQEEEQAFQVLKAQKAATRLQQERKASQNLQRKMQHLRDKQAATLKKEASECLKKIEEGQASRKAAAKYLKETIKRMHQQEAENEQQNRELVEKRIQAVKSLKSNIAANQESLRVQQSRAKANAQKKEQQQRQLRESLQAQGINSIKHMYQQKQLDEIKWKQEEFMARQKSKRVEIVAKILLEEQLVKSRKQHQAALPQPSTTDRFPSQERAREKLLYYLDPSPPSSTEERATIQLRDFSGISSSSTASSDVEDLEDPVQEEVDHQRPAESLAEPEFSGLWDQNCKPADEKLTLLQTEVKLEEPAAGSGNLNMPTKKVHGKEMKGPPFISKPEVIFFKDFDVGRTYKKKVILTNISYMSNHCKLLGVSKHLKDFISINFEPPGSLSTGMSCDMHAVFQPMINEDLEGEVQFASAVGAFSVPVRCTTKKCDLEVDCQFIDFGVHVVGQTISRTVTLTNKGALATLFSLDTSTCLIPETSNVQMPPQVSANTCQQESSQIITSDHQGSSESLGTEELQPKQGSQEELQREQPVSEASAIGPEAIPEACVSTDVDDQMYQNHLDPCDISLGNVRGGEIGPFDSIKLEVLFTPTIPGEAKLDFNIKFSDLASKPIPVQVRAVAVSVPVWVVQPSIDLKICMFDHLYQETITVQSRGNTALKLTFTVCPEMRKHMEILPKTGFIQAQSSFNAQLKFLPRPSLSKDAEEFFDRDTGVLEVPLTVQVAGQVKPVHFMVQAVVTSSDLQFDRTEVDFGYCSLNQSVRSCVRLTNLSLLPQDFGFLALPEFIEIQPNDGFGTLLPEETLEIDLIFSANKAKEYSFQLNCKSGINRDFRLSCRAVGVCSPLELSHSLVQFGATAVGDHSTAILHLINHQTSHNQSKQPLPLVLRDTSTPVAPRLFSFTPPTDSNISITPSAGSLLPGERCLVQVTFRPRLTDQEIRDEALRLLQAKTLREKELERNRHAEQETKREVPVEPSKGKKASVNRNNSKVSDGPKTDMLTEPPTPADIQPGLEQYEEARASLLYSFTQRYSEYIVPCFVSDGNPVEEERQVQPAWSPNNTLFLKLQCPAVQPPLVVISNNGHNTIDFHQVAVGEKVIKRFTVQNISKESLDLGSSVLDIHDAFSLLNALRRIRPGEKHTLVLAFTPYLEKKYRETLEVRCQKMTLEMTLSGEGVLPAVTSSPPGDVLDFGYVLERESTSQVLKMQNSSAVAVGFRVHLASLSLSRPQGGADRVPPLLGSYTDPQVQSAVGTQNYSGLCVFRVVPVEGSIAPGQSQDISVTFQPDHPSVHYSDRLTVELMNKSNVCVMNLKGAASSQNMYLYGGDPLMVPIESLLPPLITNQPQLTAESEVMEKPTIPILVTLQARYSTGAITPAVRLLQVGCIRSTQPSKKNGEFLWDNVASLQQLGFSVEPSKGTVEAGQKRTITVTWTPHSRYKPYEVVQTCVVVTLKGDETNIYSVTLMAQVSSAAD